MQQNEIKTVGNGRLGASRGLAAENPDFGHPPKPGQLDAIMSRLNELLDRLGTNGGASGFAPAQSVATPAETALIRKTRAPLPDPRLVRGIIRRRQARAQFFEDELFADPAWDMLLDLTAARAEHRRVSVTSLCIASGVPTTTALRWIKVLEQADLVSRVEDDTDRRRVFITLTERGAEAMASYFEEVNRQTGKQA